MKFLHISDLHFGKVIHGVSMLENRDQTYWAEKFLALSEEIHPQAVVISGDVYDRSSPSGAAVELLSCLVEKLAELGICVMLVAGNHDSGQRLAFARSLLARQNVHIAGTVGEKLDCVKLEDDYGPVNFWLMPYVFPAAVSQLLKDESIRDYDTAVRRLLKLQTVNTAERNVIVAHQNVTAFGEEVPRGGSESAVGGVGQVDYTAFDAFDYAALGHIHAACRVGRDEVRYAGSPMCYHFNETRQAAKGPILVEMAAKNAPLQIRTCAIPPLHPMREMRGTFRELQEQELAGTNRGEYLRLVVTDQTMTPEISDFFQALADQRDSILMERVSEHRPFADDICMTDADAIRGRTTEELFADFYTERCGTEPDKPDLQLLQYAGDLLRHSQANPRQRTAVDPEVVSSLLRYLMKQEAAD